MTTREQWLRELEAQRAAVATDAEIVGLLGAYSDWLEERGELGKARVGREIVAGRWWIWVRRDWPGRAIGWAVTPADATPTVYGGSPVGYHYTLAAAWHAAAVLLAMRESTGPVAWHADPR